MDNREAGVASPDRERFGDVLAAALRSRGLTQKRLAAQLDGMAQSAVSAWINGDATPNHATVFRLEAILGLPPGYLSRHLGYLPVGVKSPCSVLEAIEADPLLMHVQRQALRALYREFTANERRSRG